MRAMRAGLWPLPLVLFACDSDLPEYWKVDRLRILAMATDPPWAQPEAAVRLTSLIAVPSGESTATYAWSWCPEDSGPENEHRCPSPLEGFSDFPPSDLGRAEEATLQLPPREVFLSLCSFEPERCDDGQLTLYVRLEVTAGPDALVGLRELTVDLEGRSHVPPVIEEFTVSVGDHTWPLEGSDLRLPASADAKLALRALGGETEVLTVSWFVRHGELEFSRSRPEDSSDERARNTWTLPDDPTPTTLWAVLRDDRGGTAWHEQTLKVTP